jgi:methionine aminotransferase
MTEFRKVHQFNVFSVSTPVQYGLSEYLRKPEHYLGVPKLFEEKRNFFVNAIMDTGLKPLRCEGTYFLLCDYSELSNKGDMEFARELTIDHGVATIPLSPFYQDPPNDKVVRICFAKENEELEEAARRIKKIG